MRGRASVWPPVFHALAVVKPSEEGEPKMHEDYKGHGIHSTSSFLPDGWKPHLYVAFSEGGQNILKNFTIDRPFATSEKAEQAGLSFARKWIDNGRPNFKP